MTVHLGIDFDNTLVSYDDLFWKVAVEKNLIPPSLAPEKNKVRDYLRDKHMENCWTLLQGEVYGRRILEANPYPNIMSTLSALTRAGIKISVISHKTATPYAGLNWDLRGAAKSWLEKNKFYDVHGLGLAGGDVHFEDTKASKVDRIISLGCTHFIDDLPEILNMLPDSVAKILFSPNVVDSGESNGNSYYCLKDWNDLPRFFTGHL